MREVPVESFSHDERLVKPGYIWLHGISDVIMIYHDVMFSHFLASTMQFGLININFQYQSRNTHPRWKNHHVFFSASWVISSLKGDMSG